MTTPITLADLTWTGVISTAGDGTMTTDASHRLACTIDLIRPIPGHQITVTATATPAVGDLASLVVQGVGITIQPGQPASLTHTLDPIRPVTITLANVAAARVDIEITAPDPAPPATADPWQVLALDVLAPIPSDALHWDVGRWDRAAWDSAAPAPGSLVWDQGAWDLTYWADPAQTTAWTSIIGPCTTITTQRGSATHGPVMTAQTGLLTIEALDLDPRALGITYGAPIRLYHWPTRTPIFTGWVSAISTAPLKTGGSTCTLTAVDAAARLAAITRHGARPTGGGTETWAARIARLMTSAPDVPYQTRGVTDALICPTVWETSLANHLDACVATSGGAWWADRAGGIVLLAALPADPRPLVLTDDPATAHDDTIWHYHDGAASWSSTTVLAQIEATNHPAGQDEAGEWRAADQTLIVTDPTNPAAFGGTSARVDLLAPDLAAATAAARRLLRRATTVPAMTTATTNHVNHRRPASTHRGRMHVAAQLDPLQQIVTRQRDETSDALITAVRHTITPTAWATTLALTPLETSS